MPSRRFILVLCLLTTACAPAQSQTPPAAFEVATVKLNPTADPQNGHWSLPNTGSFIASGIPLRLLMQIAWNVDSSQIANQPSWLASDLFDVNAKPEGGIVLTREQLRPLLQNLLEQRFHLVVHRETRTTPGFALVIAKGGAKLHQPAHPTHTPNWSSQATRGHLEGLNWTMPYLAQQLTPFAGFPVVDQTNLSGNYDLKLLYAPDSDGESTLPTLGAALRDTLGLELKSAKVSVETIVIDHVDRRPTEN